MPEEINLNRFERILDLLAAHANVIPLAEATVSPQTGQAAAARHRTDV